VASVDPTYNTIAAPDMTDVVADIVYDLADPPVVSFFFLIILILYSAQYIAFVYIWFVLHNHWMSLDVSGCSICQVSSTRFENILNSVVITFDTATDRALLSGNFDCEDVLDIPTAEAIALFGSGATCSFSSTTSLKITFGTGATIMPGDEITLKSLVVGSSDSTATLKTVSAGALSILTPLQSTVPVASLAASSEKVGVCDPLVLEAGKTTVAPPVQFLVSSYLSLSLSLFLFRCV
jgi:hypothetical protein